MAARYLVVFADRQNVVDRSCDARMIVLPRESQVLRKVALSDEHDAYPWHVFKHLGKVFDRTRLFTHDDHEKLAVGIQRPDVRPMIIFSRRQPPIPRGTSRPIAPYARRVKTGRRRRTWIPARRDSIAGFFHSAYVRPNDAINTRIKCLLRNPLVQFSSVRRDADKRGNSRRKSGRPNQFSTVKHVLQTVAQARDVEWVVFHLEHYAIIGRSTYRLCHGDVGTGESNESGIAFRKGPDNTIQSGDLSHVDLPVGACTAFADKKGRFLGGQAEYFLRLRGSSGRGIDA